MVYTELHGQRAYLLQLSNVMGLISWLPHPASSSSLSIKVCILEYTAQPQISTDSFVPGLHLAI